MQTKCTVTTLYSKQITELSYDSLIQLSIILDFDKCVGCFFLVPEFLNLSIPTGMAIHNLLYAVAPSLIIPCVAKL